MRLEAPYKLHLAAGGFIMFLHNPFLQGLGVRLARWSPDEVEFRLVIAERHRNLQGVLHGGLIATLMDVACGYAGLYVPEGEPERHGVTVMLNIAYLEPSLEGDVQALGRVRRSGQNLYFAEAELRSEQGLVLATAQGTFKRTGKPRQ
ncbi:PaaI family thioesterase [Pseudomonas azerbaijanoccidentalis]